MIPQKTKHTHTYRERERERERCTNIHNVYTRTHTDTCAHTCLHISIWITNRLTGCTASGVVQHAVPAVRWYLSPCREEHTLLMFNIVLFFLVVSYLSLSTLLSCNYDMFSIYLFICFFFVFSWLRFFSFYMLYFNTIWLHLL